MPYGASVVLRHLRRPLQRVAAVRVARVQVAAGDVDGDGDVSKEEFMVPWMKLFPKLTRADFDKVWKGIDRDESGTLSLPELASYYGFNLSPSAKRAGDQTKDMTDEQIMEALQMSAALQDIAAEKEARQKQKEQEELDAVAAQLAAAQQELAAAKVWQHRERRSWLGLPHTATDAEGAAAERAA